MEEKQVDALIFICPNCRFQEFESVEELRKNYGFDGKDFKTLPEFECHGCHQHHVEPKKFEKVPASWLEPF